MSNNKVFLKVVPSTSYFSYPLHFVVIHKVQTIWSNNKTQCEIVKNCVMICVWCNCVGSHLLPTYLKICIGNHIWSDLFFSVIEVQKQFGHNRDIQCKLIKQFNVYLIILTCFEPLMNNSIPCLKYFIKNSNVSFDIQIFYIHVLLSYSWWIETLKIIWYFVV